jgi:hypothetical protein
VQNNSVGFCALFGLLAIRMLRFLIDPAGTLNVVAASAMALLIISSVSARGTRSRPCSLLIPPASAPRARPHCRCRWACHHHSISYHVILGHYDVPGQLRDVAHILPVPLGDYDLGNCNFRRANGSSRKACARAGALPSDQFAQLPITPLANFDRPGEIGIIAQTPPQPHIGCIAVALSHLHGSEEVVVAIIDRRVAITDAAPPLQDQVAVIKAADIT